MKYAHVKYKSCKKKKIIIIITYAPHQTGIQTGSQNAIIPSLPAMQGYHQIICISRFLCIRVLNESQLT